MIGYEHCQAITTTDSRDVADELAGGAVRARLAACAQIVGPIQSRYWWRGTVEAAQEWQVIFKTTAGRYPALQQHIRAHHNYDLPEILCTPVVAGDPAYLTWLTAETGTHR